MVRDFSKPFLRSFKGLLYILINTYPDIDIFLGGRLEELEPEAVGQLFAPLVADDPLVLHVALVPHQDHLGVVPAVGLDLGAPSCN